MEAGADVNFQRRGQQWSGGLSVSPFHLAALQDDVGLLQLMIQRGAVLGLLGVWGRRHLVTALDLARMSKKQRVVDFLEPLYAAAAAEAGDRCGL